MVLKKTITDDELMEVAAKNINENFQDLPASYTIAMGLFIAAVAAEIFADGEEVLSTKVTDQYIIGSYKYYVTTGGNVGDEYHLIIQRDDDVISRIVVNTEAEALKFIIKHHANHMRAAI